jgi:membrane protease YdiL (CAAX protease family)
MTSVASTGSTARKMTLGLALALLVFQSLFNFGVLGALGSHVLPDPENPLAPSFALALLMLLSSAVLLPILWYFCLFRPQRTAKTLGWHFDKPLEIFIFGILGAAICLLVLTVTLVALGTPFSELLERIGSRGPSSWLMFLWIGLTAALAEETLFRGNFQQALETKMGPFLAGVLCAAIFALYHLNPNPVSLAIKFSCGLVFGLVRVKTRSLVAPAISHALFWVVAGDM